jgi:flagellar FliL protein
MAKNATPATDAAPAAATPAPNKKNGRRVLIAALAGALLTGGAAAAVWKFAGGAGEETGGDDRKSAGKKAAVKKADAKAVAAKPSRPPQFVPLEVMTVNLKDDGSAERYLQVGLTFQVTGADVEPVMKQHMPIIRSKILLLLSAKTAGELATLAGTARLAEELLAAAREPLPEAGAPDKGIVALHYSTFIVQ